MWKDPRLKVQDGNFQGNFGVQYHGDNLWGLGQGSCEGIARVQGWDSLVINMGFILGFVRVQHGVHSGLF